MKIVVLKFGGTSVGSIKRIKNVSKIVISYLKKRYKVIVVSSAMSGETNKLVKLTKQISNNFISSEYDPIVSAGEQVSCARDGPVAETARRLVEQQREACTLCALQAGDGRRLHMQAPICFECTCARKARCVDGPARADGGDSDGRVPRTP